MIDLCLNFSNIVLKMNISVASEYTYIKKKFYKFSLSLSSFSHRCPVVVVIVVVIVVVVVFIVIIVVISISIIVVIIVIQNITCKGLCCILGMCKG